MSDTFSTERLEVLRGAQALLYGQGVSSGAVNTVTKLATPGHYGEIGSQFDSNGTHRFTLDVDQSFGPYALRVAAMTGHQLYWQDNLRDDPRGVYVDAARKIFKRFTVRANYEYIEVTSRLRTTGVPTTIRDNSLTDPRNGQTLDSLLYNHGDLSGITLGGKAVSYENYRSPVASRRVAGSSRTPR